MVAREYYARCEWGGVADPLQREFLSRGLFALEDGCVVRQPHDLKRLMDDRGEAAERDLATLVHHLLDDLDENADSDRVDDLGVAEIQQQRAYPIVHQLVRAIGDLFSAHVVDVALGIQDRSVRFPLDRDFQFLSHDFFSYLTMWMVVPPSRLGEMSTSSICASMSWSPRPRL